MKLFNMDDFRNNLTQTLKYRWNDINQVVLEMIIDDVVKFVEKYNNRKETNEDSK